jgi:hypothetical protein
MALQPVTSALLRHLAADLRKADPAWWLKTAKAWEDRRFVAWSEAWGLFLTAVHFEALSDENNPLVPYFPSCGGTDEADPSPALAEFLAAPPDSFFENLRCRHRRSYSAARANLWISPCILFFQVERGLPYYLVEVNAGAGLNLVGDLTRPAKGFDSDLIAARIGLDPDPLLIEDIVQRRWLTAGALPDGMASIRELDEAADLLLELKSKEAAFVQLAACAPEEAAGFITANIPADDPDCGLIVLNMATTVRMTDADYEKYKLGMAAALKPWGDRGLWMEVESVRGELYSSTYQCRLHRLVGPTLSQHVMASIDFNAAKVDFDMEATGKFLAA